MGYFGEYMPIARDFQLLQNERKKQLNNISSLRNRPIVVYASALEKRDNSIKRSDSLPFYEILDGIQGDSIDIMLETPGGDVLVVEDWVKRIRRKFKSVSFIIPGMAKSAGTIFAMSGNEILMGPDSALGPIDGQVFLRGNWLSAGAVIDGLTKIVSHLGKSKNLDLALLTTLQSLTPGEIMHCFNAQSLSTSLVSEWLEKYKFSQWNCHDSDGRPVTLKERQEQASKTAKDLSNNAIWKSHGRSLHIEDLNQLGIKISDISSNTSLYDAIQRYYVLLTLSFHLPVLKIFESPYCNVTIHEAQVQAQDAPNQLVGLPLQSVDVECEHCHNHFPVPLETIIGAIQPEKHPQSTSGEISFLCPFCSKSTKMHFNVNKTPPTKL